MRKDYQKTIPVCPDCGGQMTWLAFTDYFCPKHMSEVAGVPSLKRLLANAAEKAVSNA